MRRPYWRKFLEEMPQNRENPLSVTHERDGLTTGISPQCACIGRRPEVSFEIHAEIPAIEPVVASITRYAQEKLGGEEKHLEVELALQELIANAVIHGCDCDAALKVKCWATYDEENGLLVVVSDPGPGFLPKHVPDPLTAANIGREYGRGVLLIRSLMDDVHYLRNGSEVHLLKR